MSLFIRNRQVVIIIIWYSVPTTGRVNNLLWLTQVSYITLAKNDLKNLTKTAELAVLVSLNRVCGMFNNATADCTKLA